MKKAHNFLVILLVVAVFMLLLAPDVYSANYCMFSFGVFAISASILLCNNIRKNKSIVLFETLFTFSFLFVNYVYPVFLYQELPYFSLFTFSFNEDIMTKCTALATVGYVAFCVGIFESGIRSNSSSKSNSFKLQPLGYVDIGILLVLYLVFLYSSLDAFRKGYTMTGSGGGFFFIFALFYVFKYFAFSVKRISKAKALFFWGLILLYVATNFVLGNRGEPLYLVVAIFYCYHTYVKKISLIQLSVIGILGFLAFYLVGKTRISSNQLGVVSREDRIESLEAEENVLMYASELIINNRSLFALVDYTDKAGYSYGLTWSSNFFSVIPYGQSFALNVIGIRPEDFATTNLNTSLVFSKNDPDRFGLGTNLIGDIYVSFGSIGVLLLMFLLGRVIRYTYNRSIQGPSYFQMLYVIFIVLSIYYPRASLFCPLQSAAWSFVLCHISIVKKK